MVNGTDTTMGDSLALACCFQIPQAEAGLAQCPGRQIKRFLGEGKRKSLRPAGASYPLWFFSNEDFR